MKGATTMAKQTKIKIETLHDGTHRHAGSYDKAGRWYPDDEYRVPGSFQVRTPSRAWPYSYLKHFYSRKYSRLLFLANPRLWMTIQGIDPESAEAAPYVAEIAERRMAA